MQLPPNINQTQSLPKPKLGDSPWVACECGNHTFDEVFSFKHVSAILSPDGQERDVPISLFECRRCGRVPEFVRKQVPFDMFDSSSMDIPTSKDTTT